MSGPELGRCMENRLLLKSRLEPVLANVASEGQDVAISARLRRVFSALLVSNILTIGVQLLLVPLLLAHWGVSLYGEWVILYTVPGYLALSDLGLITVANNRIDTLCTQRKILSANRVYFTSTLILFFIFSAVILLIFMVIWGFKRELVGIFKLLEIDSVLLIIGLLCIDSLITMFHGHHAALFRSIRRYDLAVNWQTTNRLGGMISIMVSVLLGGTPVDVALTMTAVHVIMLFILIYDLSVRIRWIRPRWMRFRSREAKRIGGLSLSFAILPVSNAAYLHLSVLVIGTVYNSAAVAGFTALRTFTRLIPQFVGIVGRSVWAEVNNARAVENGKVLIRLLKRTVIWSSGSCILFGIGYGVLGEWVFLTWTGGNIEFDRALFVAMVANAIGIAFYTSVEVFVLSTNEHKRYAIAFLAITVLQTALGVAYLERFGVIVFPIAGIVGSILIALYALRRAKSVCRCANSMVGA